MSRTVAYCALIVFLGTVVALSASVPDVLSDANGFLHSFVGEELLNTLFVIVSISLASISQLHLTFNRMEREAGRKFLVRTRRGIQQAAYFLIALLAAAIVLVVVKPLVATHPWSQSVANGLALLILLWNVLLLISVTQTVFAIGPEAPGA